LAKNLKKPWTSDDEDRLLKLHASGRSSVSIAAALKRSAKAVDARLSALRKRAQKTLVEQDPMP
jgi:DNA-binding CsgD family transcriptional regulator